MRDVRRFIRSSSLSLAFLALFALALVGQALVGHAAYNQDQVMQGSAKVTFGHYVTSADFAVDVAENWQSEYLQFFLLIVLTVWLVQRGSPESKSPGSEGRETDEQQLVGDHARSDSPPWARASGLRGALYARSLGWTMGLLFLGSWFAQSVAGRTAYNEERTSAGMSSWSWWDYVRSPDFWDRSLQNWQSEFLAVASMAVFAIYLRERGSPESKKVGAPHHATGSE
ncbi:DUF6766 family protein [Luteipulveratus mongoliensis]|uniref:Membrane protein n=1 Tax=Luteipulveratus mongoliensis TaxID=571913 RepID=A0A0K1JLH0_9MICO|nr:DUF6766 family protein [Luteipulveratus mongoliensis]AKU17423.1 membrane protein [Luteipulveratus mongoliensis]